MTLLLFERERLESIDHRFEIRGTTCSTVFVVDAIRISKRSTNLDYINK